MHSYLRVIKQRKNYIFFACWVELDSCVEYIMLSFHKMHYKIRIISWNSIKWIARAVLLSTEFNIFKHARYFNRNIVAVGKVFIGYEAHILNSLKSQKRNREKFSSGASLGIIKFISISLYYDTEMAMATATGNRQRATGDRYGEHTFSFHIWV